MKNIFYILLFLCLLGISYALPAVSIPQAFYINATVPLQATGVSINGTLKQGESVAESYFLLFTFGDAGIKEAAKNGGIKRIVSVERKEAAISFAGLFPVIRFKTIVYGY